jgi:glycerol-3-phosphate cytidylyltransferase-like family protein
LAPPQKERFEAMKSLDWKHKAVVVEPILNYDPEFADWIKEIKPETVYVGYDNYNNKLPEPELSKTQVFIDELKGATQVEVMDLRKAWFET